MRERGWEPEGDAERPEREAELLRWVLDARERERRPRGEVASTAAEARELAELERLLDTCRSAARELDEIPAHRRRRLVQSVLAQTTREDLSWRGDVRLLAGFVRARLRSSPALRVAAASLLVHLLALPVVAWYGWSRLEDEGPTVRFETERPKPPFEEGTGDEERVPPVAPDAADPFGRPVGEGDGALYVANSRGWARFQIRDGVPELPVARGPESALARLLRARVAALGGSAEDALAGAKAPDADALLVERALWCELLLDAHLRRTHAPQALEPALLALARQPLPADAAGLLAAAALARAESYGALPVAAVDALWRAREELASVPGAAALLSPGGDLRRVAPLDPLWIDVLARAAGAELPGELVEALRER